MTNNHFKDLPDPYERPDYEPEGKGIAIVIFLVLVSTLGFVGYLLFKLLS